MEKLLSTKKITLASLKSFARRNKNNLFYQPISSFSGMTDGIEFCDRKWRPTELTNDTGYYQTGIQGIYTVGSSRDYFSLFEDISYIGIKVNNFFGSAILAIKKYQGV